MAGGLVAGDDAADGRRDDEVDPPEAGLAHLVGERPAELLGPVGIHEDPRLLDEDRAAQAGAQDEMALEDGARARGTTSITSASLMAHRPSAIDPRALLTTGSRAQLRDQPGRGA